MLIDHLRWNFPKEDLYVDKSFVLFKDQYSIKQYFCYKQNENLELSTDIAEQHGLLWPIKHKICPTVCYLLRNFEVGLSQERPLLDENLHRTCLLQMCICIHLLHL